jgi:hypothetical protein
VIEFSGTVVRRPRGRLAGAFPWPFVGTAVILSTLVVLTPALFDGALSAGSFLTGADLIVDRVADTGATNFYVRGVDSSVRYQSISVGIASGFSWNGGTPPLPTAWSWTNESEVLELGVNASANPVAINVTAVYSGGGSMACYAGVLAFYVSGSGSGETLSIYVYSSTSGMYAPSTPLSLSQLPEPLALEDFGTGCPP